MYEEHIVALKKCGYPGDVHYCRDCGFANDGETCRMKKLLPAAAEAIERLSNAGSAYGRGWTLGYDAGKEESKPRWIPVTERLPECDLGAEVGNIEWIICGMVHAGCFGRGGKYRDAYFRTWTDAGEGIDAKDADYWRAVTLPKPPKEE